MQNRTEAPCCQGAKAAGCGSRGIGGARRVGAERMRAGRPRSQGMPADGTAAGNVVEGDARAPGGCRPAGRAKVMDSFVDCGRGMRQLRAADGGPAGEASVPADQRRLRSGRGEIPAPGPGTRGSRPIPPSSVAWRKAGRRRWPCSLPTTCTRPWPSPPPKPGSTSSAKSPWP